MLLADGTAENTDRHTAGNIRAKIAALARVLPHIHSAVEGRPGIDQRE